MNYSEDLKICEGATEGPWEWDGEEVTGNAVVVGQEPYIVAGEYGAVKNKNGKYIAHFNPTYVTQLITSLRDVTKEAELLREQAQRAEELERAAHRVIDESLLDEGGTLSPSQDSLNALNELVKINERGEP